MTNGEVRQRPAQQLRKVNPMRRALRVFLLVVFCLSASIPAHAQNNSAQQSDFQQAVELRRQGKFEQAAKAFRTILEEQPNNDRAWLNLAICVHSLKDYQGAIEIYTKAAKFPRVRQTALYNTACAHALLGHSEPALESLEAAIEAGFSNASLIRNDSDLDSLREDKRFDEIVDSIGRQLSRRLHFWIGEWDCYSNSTGLLNGRNNLEARLGETVIHEMWTPVGRSAGGESWNYYDPQTRTWRQHWMNPNGQPFVYVGKPVEEGILFEGPRLDGTENQLRKRMFIRPIGNGRVQHTGTKSADGGKTWQPEYDLIYVPRGEAFNKEASPQKVTVADDPARQFDFLVGEWRMDVEQYDPQGKLIRTLSEWSRVRTMIGGASLIDNWNDSGFTIRTWDPRKQVWRLFWTDRNSSAGKMQLWEGTFENGIGTFIGGMSVPYKSKRITSKIEFSEITDNSVLWKMWKTSDAGQTWVLDYIRHYTRTAR